MKNNVKNVYSIHYLCKKDVCIYLHMNVCVKNAYLLVVDIEYPWKETGNSGCLLRGYQVAGG